MQPVLSLPTLKQPAARMSTFTPLSSMALSWFNISGVGCCAISGLVVMRYSLFCVFTGLRKLLSPSLKLWLGIALDLNTHSSLSTLIAKSPVNTSLLLMSVAVDRYDCV